MSERECQRLMRPDIVLSSVPFSSVTRHKSISRVRGHKAAEALMVVVVVVVRKTASLSPHAFACFVKMLVTNRQSSLYKQTKIRSGTHKFGPEPGDSKCDFRYWCAPVLVFIVQLVCVLIGKVW